MVDRPAEDEGGPPIVTWDLAESGYPIAAWDLAEGGYPIAAWDLAEGGGLAASGLFSTVRSAIT